VFLLFRLVFRFSLSESVLAVLTASAPAVPFRLVRACVRARYGVLVEEYRDN
jgi:hypothetical protein